MFSKVRITRRYEEIVDQVLEAIRSGGLQPGDKLPSEKEFTEISGASRGSVREAIRSLEQFGIVEVRQGPLGGAFVRPMNLDTIVSQIDSALRMTHITLSQLNQARALLEEAILSNMTRPDNVETFIRRMEATIVEAEARYHANDAEGRLKANLRFHALIAEMTGNPIIVLMHKLLLHILFDFFIRVRSSVPLIEKTIAEHKQIVELLKREDYRQASLVCTSHIREVSDMIVAKSRQQTLKGRPSKPDREMP